MSDMEQQLLQLNKMSKRSVCVYHKFALHFGISDSSLGVLYALPLAGTPCSQYELCSQWSIPKQTINTAVAALKKRGLVSLSPVAGTRNKKNIALTDEGKAFAEKTVLKLRDAELYALSSLTDEERELYVNLNKKYNDSLTERLSYILAQGEN